jgi:hypothetical protein
LPVVKTVNALTKDGKQLKDAGGLILKLKPVTVKALTKDGKLLKDAYRFTLKLKEN